VVGNEIFGDVLLLFAFATIIRSKCIMKSFNLEMVSVEIGLAGIVMFFIYVNIISARSNLIMMWRFYFTPKLQKTTVNLEIFVLSKFHEISIFRF